MSFYSHACKPHICKRNFALGLVFKSELFFATWQIPKVICIIFIGIAFKVYIDRRIPVVIVNVYISL